MNISAFNLGRKLFCIPLYSNDTEAHFLIEHLGIAGVARREDWDAMRASQPNASAGISAKITGYDLTRRRALLQITP